VTTLVLATITLFAAVVLVGVMWSLFRAMRAESANARLRRDGVRAAGTVLDNTMTSTPQRRLVFSPVVEFRARDGRAVMAPAQQVSATSWPRGATVEVAYDPSDPTRFVLAGPPARGHLVANAFIGLVVVAGMVATMVITYQIWDQFRHDKGGQPQPASTAPAAVSSGAE
jgi:Protein of unknown function (DUF3592)